MEKIGFLRRSMDFCEDPNLLNISMGSFSNKTRFATAAEFIDERFDYTIKQQKWIETCIIIWLDAHNNEKFEELQNNLSSIQLFTDRNACVDYVTDLSFDEHHRRVRSVCTK